jgi:hypothetical protein
MKVIVVKYNQIKLIPDNDSDLSLLGMWADMQARVDSSQFSGDTHRTESLILGFQERPYETRLSEGMGKIIKQVDDASLETLREEIGKIVKTS